MWWLHPPTNPIPTVKPSFHSLSSSSQTETGHYYKTLLFDLPLLLWMDLIGILMSWAITTPSISNLFCSNLINWHDMFSFSSSQSTHSLLAAWMGWWWIWNHFAWRFWFFELFCALHTWCIDAIEDHHLIVPSATLRKYTESEVNDDNQINPEDLRKSYNQDKRRNFPLQK